MAVRRLGFPLAAALAVLLTALPVALPAAPYLVKDLTHRVADLVPGPRGSAPHDLVRFQKRVYFLAGNPGEGESLWSTDGTARGTTRVLDLTLDGQPSWGRSLTVAAGRLFFTVYNETTGAELWASTGDTVSTGLVTDLNPGPGSSSAQSLTTIGGTLLFARQRVVRRQKLTKKSSPLGSSLVCRDVPHAVTDTWRECA